MRFGYRRSVAGLIGMEKDLGGLEPGKYADVIAVSEDPLQSIHALRTIGFVMKGGAVVRNDWAAKSDR